MHTQVGSLIDRTSHGGPAVYEEWKDICCQAVSSVCVLFQTFIRQCTVYTFIEFYPIFKVQFIISLWQKYDVWVGNMCVVNPWPSRDDNIEESHTHKKKGVYYWLW